MTTRTLTDTDKREIRDVEDLIATLTSYADSIARVGFDKHYAAHERQAPGMARDGRSDGLR